MIRECRYGIHDLSRIELNEAQYPRFNMPFELGIFFGARYIGTGEQKKKNADIPFIDFLQIVELSIQAQLE
jgi:hypothetical protein